MRCVGLVGASGRMGRRIRHLLEVLEHVELLRCFGRNDRLDFSGLDVVIDFSLPEATSAVVEALQGTRAALVSGVTGHRQEQLNDLHTLSGTNAVLVAANFSLGVHVLAHLVSEASKRLDEDFHIEITEQHHARKRDLPSGTALFLGEAAASGRGRSWPEVYVDRSCGTPRDRDDEIGISGLRGGVVIGTHSVHFLGQQEVLELTHTATDRDVFAMGAVKTASWIVEQPPGTYTMSDFIRSYVRK
ncbi:MAG: 4-hydroxy-tetrahydrodipicolinate reductase [Bradymonadia bacterium]